MNNRVGRMGALERVRNAALGTDGIGADLLEELRFAWFRRREAGGRGARRICCACWGAGSGCWSGWSALPIGRLEPGCRADLVVWDYRPPTPLLAENLAGHLLYGLSSRDVRSVLVDGRWVYEERRFARTSGRPGGRPGGPPGGSGSGWTGWGRTEGEGRRGMAGRGKGSAGRRGSRRAARRTRRGASGSWPGSWRQDTAEELSELIRIPSFSGREEQVCRHLAARCREIGLEQVRLDGLGSVVARLGKGAPLLAFDAHVDTVEPGDERGWSRSSPSRGWSRTGWSTAGAPPTRRAGPPPCSPPPAS